MAAARLSPLDTSFLRVEGPTAHMHVGWAAELEAPQDGSGPPTYARVREHVAGRLARAPRYRQRLLGVPFDLNDPVWCDDDGFDVARHVVHAPRPTLGQLADEALSTPLDHARPLWEVWVSDALPGGRLGIVGKAHHCLVDGVAAVELASLLLDPTPEPAPPEPDDWAPAPAPGAVERLAGGVADRVRESAALAAGAARLVTSPERLREAPAVARGAVAALERAARGAPESLSLNPPSSPLRGLGMADRDLDDLGGVRRRFGATVNDVVLAACAGAVRRMLQRRGDRPGVLKAMVPATVRADGELSELGNRISFLFAELPCHEPGPAGRLQAAMAAMRESKGEGNAGAGDALLRAVRALPRPLHGVLARRAAGASTYNLVVSNIPGPPEPLYLLGCRLRAAYPVVPLSERHALAIGVTSVGRRLCFGVHVDRLALDEGPALAADLGEEVDALAALGAPRRPRGARGARRTLTAV